MSKSHVWPYKRILSLVTGIFGGIILGALFLGWASSQERGAEAQVHSFRQSQPERIRFVHRALTHTSAATDTSPLYLPILANRWPPLPYPPEMNPIDNVDGDATYTVIWAAADLAQTYSLEEDVSADFPNPAQVYSGTDLSWTVPAPGKMPGSYFYRVRGHNAWGYGEYSNVETVTAVPFRADDSSLPAGQCTTLHWAFDSIKALYISFGYGYDKEGVPGHGTRQVCPSVTTTYEALAVKDGGDETYQVTIDVSGTGCGDPVIQAFYANTYNVQPGEQFGIAWDVDCAKTVHLIIGNGPEEPVTGEGSKNVRIYTTAVFTLKVQKTDGNYVYRTFTVYVSS
jgi:hypothetical protein